MGIIEKVSVKDKQLVLCPGLIKDPVDPILVHTSDDGQSVLCLATGDRILQVLEDIGEAREISFLWSEGLLTPGGRDFAETRNTLWRRGWLKKVSTNGPRFLVDSQTTEFNQLVCLSDDRLLAEHFEALKDYHFFAGDPVLLEELEQKITLYRQKERDSEAQLTEQALQYQAAHG